jgi:hypothetical protein
VRAGQSGATVEELVAAYLGGQLTIAPDGCEHHDHEADRMNSRGKIAMSNEANPPIGWASTPYSPAEIRANHDTSKT